MVVFVRILDLGPWSQRCVGINKQKAYLDKTNGKQWNQRPQYLRFFHYELTPVCKSQSQLAGHCRTVTRPRPRSAVRRHCLTVAALPTEEGRLRHETIEESNDRVIKKAVKGVTCRVFYPLNSNVTKALNWSNLKFVICNNLPHPETFPSVFS